MIPPLMLWRRWERQEQGVGVGTGGGGWGGCCSAMTSRLLAEAWSPVSSGNLLSSDNADPGWHSVHLVPCRLTAVPQTRQVSGTHSLSGPQKRHLSLSVPWGCQGHTQRRNPGQAQPRLEEGTRSFYFLREERAGGGGGWEGWELHAITEGH